MPLVSVILPARNAVATLPAAVASIRKQTFPDWELLVVDDASTDGTGAAARRWATLDRRVRVVHAAAQFARQNAGNVRQGRGIVEALQTGLAQATGAFIARMDADDVSHPDRLRAQIQFLEAHPEIGLVGCLVEYGGNRQSHRGYALHVDWLNQIVTPEQIRLNRFVESPFAHPSVMFRRPLIEQHGDYRQGDFPEDYELWLRWLAAGVAMAKVPRVLLTWNDARDRLSRTDPRYATKAFYQIKAGYLARAVKQIRGRRAVWVWGAGRPTRRRAEYLAGHGVEIAGYVDIDPRKSGRIVGQRPVVCPAKLPGPGEALVLGYVGSRGARALIRSHLQQRGFVEGEDFWMGA